MPPERPPTVPRIAARFDLDDQAERFMLDVIQRYHTERKGLCTLATMRRIVRDTKRIVLTATSFCPRRKSARREWDVIEWNIDEISIRFLAQPSRAAAVREVKART